MLNDDARYIWDQERTLYRWITPFQGIVKVEAFPSR
ncbi:hypothetical protein GGU45_003984 [Niabella hirudinis]